MNRDHVYTLIDGERAYQDRVWNDDQTPQGVHQHSPIEWLVFLQDYLSEAIHQATRIPGPESTALVMGTVRKITAMGVAAMEQHGAPPR